MRLPGKAVAASAVLAALLAPAAASADTVTNLADSGAGSLRSAIAAGGTVTFAPGLSGTIVLASQLEIDKNLTIEGPGARALAVSGNDAARVFHVSGTGVEATIRDLTIRDGTVPDAAPIGAGVLADGDAALLRLERVAVVDNEASSASQLPLGGGVAVVDGKLELVDSTVAGNRALAGGGGGGVMVGVPATFEIVNSTIAGNIATVGGGLLSISGTGTIRAATIAGNTAAGAGPAIGASGAPVAVERSLLTGNGPAACAGDVTSGGDNVVDTTCFDTPAASDAIGVTAPVGTLGPNGGPTDTLLPLAGSAAIDHLACTGADQRAVARPQGAACDAGAVENRPARLVASGPLALGSAVVGQHSAPASITVTNNGDFDATITGISLAGPNAAEVEPVADPDACSDATVLGAGETCVLKARLSPTSAGAKTATYSVAMGAAVVDVPVSGTGLRPALLEFSAPLALGSAVVGQHSAAGTTIITNTGEVDATITAVTLTGPNAAEVEPVADPDACSDATVLGGGRDVRVEGAVGADERGGEDGDLLGGDGRHGGGRAGLRHGLAPGAARVLGSARARFARSSVSTRRPVATIITNTGDVDADDHRGDAGRAERGRGRAGGGSRRVLGHDRARGRRNLQAEGAAGADESRSQDRDLCGHDGSDRPGGADHRHRRPAPGAADGFRCDGARCGAGRPALGAGLSRDHQRRRSRRGHLCGDAGRAECGRGRAGGGS